MKAAFAFRETGLIGLEDPGSHSAWGHVRVCRPRPSSWPGLGSSHAPSATGPGVRLLYLGYHAMPEKGHVWGVLLPRSRLLSGREGCWLHSGRQASSGLRTPAAIFLGVTSLRAGPAPLPGLGLGLATPLAPLAQGSGCCTWVTMLGPKRAMRGVCSLPEAAFLSGRAGCWLHSGRQA